MTWSSNGSGGLVPSLEIEGSAGLVRGSVGVVTVSGGDVAEDACSDGGVSDADFGASSSSKGRESIGTVVAGIVRSVIVL